MESREKDFDLGLDIGAGVDLKIKDNFWITVDARYSLGLIDLSEIDGVSNNNTTTVVSVGILLGL